MVVFHTEGFSSVFDGTIIDIETIGEFCREYSDSRLYKYIVPIIFGYIDKGGLNIYCAKSHDSLDTLRGKVSGILPILKRPFSAFNCCFEVGVLHHAWGVELPFDRELNKEKYEPKYEIRCNLGISNYNDPFNDIGRLCKEAWERGDINNAIAHNRSCLLKERDVMLKRGYRDPDIINLYK